MQNRVFVLDQNKRPLMPCHPARARELLNRGEAAVFRRFPFTVILKKQTTSEQQPQQLSFDPGSRKTGVALVVQGKRGNRCVWAATLHHRGLQVREGLQTRHNLRRSRRHRKTRYRKPRFQNRTRPKGWLAPSLQSRVQNILTWTQRLQRWTPLTSLACEVVRFDMQRLQNPEVQGVEYQQGTLQGYEVREYLLEKFQRTCVYCKAQALPLQIEHVVPKSRGGSNAVTNLTLACSSCNQKKGKQTVAEFGFPEVQKQARKTLRDAAAVNSTRQALFQKLKDVGLPVESGTGGQTKYQRTQQGYAKMHWLDAVCVGTWGQQVFCAEQLQTVDIIAKGRGTRQMCRVDKYGFPRTSAKSRIKQVHGFQTGDLVSAKVPKGKKKGIHRGRAAVRKNGFFNIQRKAACGNHPKKTIQGISYNTVVCFSKPTAINTITLPPLNEFRGFQRLQWRNILL